MITPSIIEMGGKASRMLIMALVVAFLSFVVIGFVSLVAGYQIVPILLKTMQTTNSNAILDYSQMKVTQRPKHQETQLPEDS